MAVTIKQVTPARFEAFGFLVGSLLFAAGALVSQFALTDVSRANQIFVVGAICFTIGAAAEVAIAISSQVTLHGKWSWKQGIWNPDLLSASFQLAGCIYFNVMTIQALALQFVDSNDANDLVWRPEIYGSALFLASALLAWYAITGRRRRPDTPRHFVWISRANLCGAIAFAVSAFGARYMDDGTLKNPTEANLGTFVGALFFLVGAVLVFPSWDEYPADRLRRVRAKRRGSAPVA